jgi:CRP-like cAMP-binding protein/ABC-type multidrug transport system ATPase subunit
MLNLAMRFYDASAGTVCYDGVDVKTARLKSLRDQCGIVFQESFLFNESVRANIRHSRSDATDDEIIAAARAAEIHDLILTLPQGYDTPVGERGGKLSGGQRQRIAIARALLRNPGILVLDEATSALDPGTEAQLNQTLERAAQGRTVLSVTHRLDAVVNYDLILVFDKGELVEQGRHPELVARNGLYARLVQKQTGLHVKTDGHAAIEPTRLRDLSMFSQVPDSVLAEAAALFTSHTLEADREVFREGDAPDNFYLIARGRVAVFKRTGDTDQRLRVLEAGDAFGEIALLQDSPRTATIRTLVPTTLLALSRVQFEGLLARSRELRVAIGALADERLQAESASEALYSFLFGSRETVGTTPAPEQVSGLPILREVPPEQRLETIGLFTTVEVEAGQAIFYEGAPSDAFYLVVSGSVTVTQGAGAEARALGKLGAGDAFGEMALLDDLPRMATLRAQERTRLLRLRRETFIEFLHRVPGIERHLRELAAERRAANQTHAPD